MQLKSHETVRLNLRLKIYGLRKRLYEIWREKVLRKYPNQVYSVCWKTLHLPWGLRDAMWQGPKELITLTNKGKSIKYIYIRYIWQVVAILQKKISSMLVSSNWWIYPRIYIHANSKKKLESWNFPGILLLESSESLILKKSPENTAVQWIGVEDEIS